MMQKSSPKKAEMLPDECAQVSTNLAMQRGHQGPLVMQGLSPKKAEMPPDECVWVSRNLAMRQGHQVQGLGDNVNPVFC